jgi:glycosyltransferase involved in cell wall biosynthesis
MRICFTNFSDLDEPTTLNAFHLAEGLAERGHEVTMLLPRTGQHRFIEGSQKVRLEYFPVISSPREVKILSQSLVQSVRAISQQFEVIQAFKPLPQSAIPAIVAGWLRGQIKVLYWDDYEAFGQLLNPKSNPLYAYLIGLMERKLVERFDGVLCVSPFLASLASQMSRRVLLVPNGFDPRVFSKASGEKIRKKFGIQGNLIVYTGGLKPWADIDLLIRAMLHVIEKVPDTSLLIVGEGEARQELLDLTIQLNLQRRVIFAGGVPHADVPHYLAAADVLALPLRDNTFNKARFPNRIAEYMASGKPIVTNKVGIAAELFRNNYNAIVVDSDNPRSFADGILELLRDEKKARRLGTRAKEYSWQNLTWVKIAEKVENFYFELLGQRSD